MSSLTTEHRKLLTALASLADETGLVHCPPPEEVAGIAGLSKSEVHQAMRELIGQRRIEVPTPGNGVVQLRTEDLVLNEPTKRQEPAPAKSKPTADKPGKSTPKPKVLYREPKDQTEHRRAVRDLLRGKGITRAVALEAHDQIGMTYAGGSTPFGQVKRELTSEYLAGFLGFSPRKVRESMNEAVVAGLFLRVDNGAGGKAGKNRSTYRAIVPAHWNMAGHAMHEVPTLD